MAEIHATLMSTAMWSSDLMNIALMLRKWHRWLRWFRESNAKLSRPEFIRSFNALPSPREGCDGRLAPICMGKGEGGGNTFPSPRVSII